MKSVSLLISKISQEFKFDSERKSKLIVSVSNAYNRFANNESDEIYKILDDFRISHYDKYNAVLALCSAAEQPRSQSSDDNIAKAVGYIELSNMYSSDKRMSIQFIADKHHNLGFEEVEAIKRICESNMYSGDKCKAIRAIVSEKPATSVNTYSGRPKTTTGNSTIDLICDAIDIANFLGKL